MTSSYFRSLDDFNKERYLEKLMDGLFPDPYDEIVRHASFQNNVMLLPLVEFPDIFTYLINSPGIFTKENLKAYKSLEAYNFFYSGKVREIVSFASKDEGRVLVFAKVEPSQSLTSSLHEAWIATKPCGEIVCGHCNCMAGLGEVCSHVAALLFAIMAIIKEREDNKPSCTSQRMSWKTPSLAVSADAIENINFSQPSCDPSQGERSSDVNTESIVPPRGVFKNLLLSLADAVPDAAIFTVVQKHKINSEETETASEDESYLDNNYILPTLITDLYQEKYRSLPVDTLAVLSQSKFDALHHEDDAISYLERCTKNQCESELWKKYRQGIITASIMHEILILKESTSPVTIIKKVMGYEKTNLSHLPQIKWGRGNEKVACKAFISSEAKNHVNFVFKSAGLMLTKCYPYLGASPDGFVSCHCCGTGVVEIKCPYSLKDADLSSDAFPSNFCLDNNKRLKINHKYYSQIQGQMAVTERKFCFFIVWTSRSLIVDLVQFDDRYWGKTYPRLESFFLENILPEVLTRRLEIQEPEKLWCYCQHPESGRMIACDSNKCEIIWFHFKCVNLTRKPRSKWYCEECTLLSKLGAVS